VVLEKKDDNGRAKGHVLDWQVEDMDRVNVCDTSFHSYAAANIARIRLSQSLPRKNQESVLHNP
jgi:hypothetical protein